MYLLIVILLTGPGTMSEPFVSAIIPPPAVRG